VVLVRPAARGYPSSDRRCRQVTVSPAPPKSTTVTVTNPLRDFSLPTQIVFVWQPRGLHSHPRDPKTAHGSLLGRLRIGDLLRRPQRGHLAGRAQLAEASITSFHRLIPAILAFHSALIVRFSPAAFERVRQRPMRCSGPSAIGDSHLCRVGLGLMLALFHSAMTLFQSIANPAACSSLPSSRLQAPWGSNGI
jgi:hypothetical protein